MAVSPWVCTYSSLKLGQGKRLRPRSQSGDMLNSKDLRGQMGIPGLS